MDDPIRLNAQEEHQMEAARSYDWDTDSQLNPLLWSKRRKCTIATVGNVLTFICGLNSLALSGVTSKTNSVFGISDDAFPNSYWSVTAWNGGAVLSPLVGLPFMENYGVRIGYIASYALFYVFVIPQAITSDYATFLVCRFLAGAFGGIVMNAVANINGDIWEPTENSFPVTCFIFAYLFGFTLGPVVGAGIAQYLQWRWIIYIELIFYAPFLLLIPIMLPETRASVILKAKRNGHSQTFAGLYDNNAREFLKVLYDGTVRPLYLFTTQPVCFFYTLWSGFAVVNVFMASESIAQVYRDTFGFSEISSAYVQGSMAVGEVFGFILGCWQNYLYEQSAVKNIKTPSVPIPEHRLTLSIPGSLIGMCGGLFVYAWTAYPSLPWIAPTIGMALVGMGIMISVQGAVSYLALVYGIYGGSAVAAVAAVENLFTAFLPLAVPRMYTVLGPQWASSLLAFAALLLTLSPVILFLKGPSIRARSSFMEAS